MNILKFGGTSVADAAGIRNVRNIIDAEIRKSGSFPVVVVSACGGVTDALIQAGTLAVEGNEEFRIITRNIEKRHLALANELLTKESYIQSALHIASVVRTLDKLTYGVYLVKELTAKTKDKLLALGEQLSANILSGYLNATGITAEYYNAADFLITDDVFGNARIEFGLSTFAVKELLLRKKFVPVVTGFTGKTLRGEITTLGRGGSDYTATVLANILGAEKVELWTDVNGFYTADPAKVPSAGTIPVLSYEEAFAVTDAGAKVIYPPAIEPAHSKKIPVYVKSAAEPQKSGTLITEQKSGVARVTAVSLYENASLISVPLQLSFNGNVVPGKILNILKEENLPVLYSSGGRGEKELLLCAPAELSEAIQQTIIRYAGYGLLPAETGRVTVTSDISVLSVITPGEKCSPVILSELLSVLSKCGATVYGVNASSTSLITSVIISANDQDALLNAVHNIFFPGKIQRTDVEEEFAVA